MIFSKLKKEENLNIYVLAQKTLVVNLAVGYGFFALVHGSCAQ